MAVEREALDFLKRDTMITPTIRTATAAEIEPPIAAVGNVLM